MRAKKNAQALSEEQFLKLYNPEDYIRPSVTTDLLILGINKDYSSLKVLLVKSNLLDVHRSVNIPIMCMSAMRTCPLSVVERHALEDVATLVAHLRGRKEPVVLDISRK